MRRQGLSDLGPPELKGGVNGEGRHPASPLPQVRAVMSSPGRASSAYPLHVLVWNNDYRRLDEELQDKVSETPGRLRGW